MTRRLAHRGYHRGDSQTPSEFAASIADLDLREAVSRFTVAYQHARYGASSAAAANLPALMEQVKRTLSR
jgi:hypothetical protein